MAAQLPIIPTQPIGTQLKARRQQLRLSLAQLEAETKIRGKYLTALEACDYDVLPNDVYSRGFVQHYANHLGMDGRLAAAAYEAERGGMKAGETSSPRLNRARRLVLTGPLLAGVAGILVVGAVVAYLGYQFTALAAAPRLDLTSPTADQTLTGSVVDVSGTTTPGADVSINDSPVLTDTNGSFSEKVAVRNGLNTVRVASRSKLGKTTTVTRNVRATLPTVEAGGQTIPAIAIDGVAIDVAVKRTTSLVVVADGKEVWRGTLLAGTNRVFGGPGVQDLKLTTGDAGGTSVTITNTVGASKRIDKLGADGEIRRNQDFARDTVIP